MPVVLDPPALTRGSGAPDRSLAGSGLAVPTSLAKTVYDARGLLLNNRGDIDRYWLSKIDGLYDAEVRDSRDVNADHDGETFYGGLYAGKPLTVEGNLWARQYEKWLDMRMALSEAFDDISDEFPLVGRTGDFTRDWVIYVVKTAQISMADYLDGPWFKTDFQLQLRASRPRIYSYQIHSASTNLNTSNFIQVTNRGNREAVPRILLFGAQNNVVINVDTNGQQFRLKPAHPIPAGRYYEIDFDPNNSSIVDDLGVNRFNDYDHTSDWIELPRNVMTTLEIVSDGRDANAAATVYWQDTYK